MTKFAIYSFKVSCFFFVAISHSLLVGADGRFPLLMTCIWRNMYDDVRDSLHRSVCVYVYTHTESIYSYRCGCACISIEKLVNKRQCPCVYVCVCECGWVVRALVYLCICVLCTRRRPRESKPNSYYPLILYVWWSLCRVIVSWLCKFKGVN